MKNGSKNKSIENLTLKKKKNLTNLNGIQLANLLLRIIWPYE